MIRIEDFQCEGLLPILESFPSYKSAIDFVMAFRPSFVKSPQNIALQKHFTKQSTKYKYDCKIEYWFLDRKVHRNDGPARIEYYPTGQKCRKIWYIQGTIHRDDKPAEIWYGLDGSKTRKSWYIHGKLHRDGNPSQIVYRNGLKSYEYWHQYGKLHRNDGSALIVYMNG